MFDSWLKDNSKLRDSSVYNYVHAINTISREMMERKVISKPLGEMELFEIDLAIALIFRDEYFLNKNEIGNKMYSNALKWYRSYVQSNVFDSSVVLEEEKKIMEDSSIAKTERETIVKSRIGQGQFRHELLKKYGVCIITGIDIPRTLVASHIKPWAVSSNKERVSVNNGLLLSATFDRLFDSGLISFSDQGKIIISRFVSDANKRLLGIKNGEKYNLLCNNEMKDYLNYHNDVVFIK